MGLIGRRRPAETAEVGAEPVVNGFFRGRERVISGWILDNRNPERKHDVDVFVDGKRIGSARGDRFDGLVQSHHGGDGNYAFAIYYDGELTGPLEAKVVDAESGTELRSKQPMVSQNAVSGAPLEIHRVILGKSAEIQGRIGAYPWGNALSLEIWSGQDRVVSSVPVIGSQAEGTFTAHLDDHALHYLLSGDVEIALPGLKEAGLAVPIPRIQILASIMEHENSLRVQLTGNFEQSGPLPVKFRFLDGNNAVEDEISTSSRVIEVRKPAGFDLGSGAIEILYCGTAIRTRIEWPVLEDVQFRNVGEPSSPWRASDNAAIENGFFAFPAELADEHSVSGHIAHVARVSGSDPLALAQEIRELPGGKDSASITVFVRSTKKAQVKARLRDSDGILAESSATSRSNQEWSVLRVDLKNKRSISTDLTFEVEASGRKVTDLDVALGNSRRIDDVAITPESANLLRNPGLQEWPNGPGLRQHAMLGEICSGWTVINRGTPSPVYTRAIMHPIDGNLGLAVAATEVRPFLRLEADLSVDDLDDRPLRLRFRAGATLAATQMLAQHVEPISQFAVIDRVHVVRRTRLTTSNSFEERDDTIAVFARKLPITREIEQFEFDSMAAEAPDVEYSDDTEVEESFRLVFDFRNPTVISLFDVEVTAPELSEKAADSSRLAVEDRNIQLQIETLKSVAHWRGPTPVRLASDKPLAVPPPLKWSSREPVTIVIPVFNALSETLACLDSLNGSTTVPILVRVIDDGSDQTVREALDGYARDKPWVQVRSLERNKGYTFAADFGIRSADTEWVVLLNSDTLVTRGWLEGMLTCARSNPNVAFVGPLSNAASYQSIPELYDASRKWKVNRLPSGMTPEDMAGLVRKVSLKDYPEVPLLNGFCTLMKRSVFVGLGGLNSAAFPAGYGEENDLCLRAGKAGVVLAVADDVYVYHVKSASFGNARRQELTKQGNEALRKLHPEIDISLLTARFRETPALVAVRQAIATELADLDGAIEECEALDELPVQESLDDQSETPQLQKA
ncbi:MAG TPA: glycosyltransferase family 2 protein [Sphingomicrobium sp.]|nr:glycosyltransferase family 2 protein [Sphingomicrobium sp.]